MYFWSVIMGWFAFLTAYYFLLILVTFFLLMALASFWAARKVSRLS